MLKQAASQAYAGDAEAVAVVLELCRQHHIPCQQFVNRSDIPGGSTLGSIASALVPIRTMIARIQVNMGIAAHNHGDTLGFAELQHPASDGPGIGAGTSGTVGTVIDLQQHVVFSGGLDHRLIVQREKAVVRMADDLYQGIPHDGDEPKKLFILLSGQIRIQKDTLSGRQILIADIERPGDMFGEIYLFIARRAYDMYAEAVRDTEVLELSNELFTLEQGQSGHLSALLRQNLLRIFAGKAYFMNNRLKVLASGSLRGKITRYLFQLGAEQGEIELPVGREELAALLAATRPSLSRELSAMNI